MKRFEEALIEYGGAIRFNRKDLTMVGRATMYDHAVGKIKVIETAEPTGKVVPMPGYVMEPVTLKVPPDWEVRLKEQLEE